MAIFCLLIIGIMGPITSAQGAEHLKTFDVLIWERGTDALWSMEGFKSWAGGGTHEAIYLGHANEFLEEYGNLLGPETIKQLEYWGKEEVVAQLGAAPHSTDCWGYSGANIQSLEQASVARWWGQEITTMRLKAPILEEQARGMVEYMSRDIENKLPWNPLEGDVCSSWVPRIFIKGGGIDIRLSLSDLGTLVTKYIDPFSKSDPGLSGPGGIKKSPDFEEVGKLSDLLPKTPEFWGPEGKDIHRILERIKDLGVQRAHDFMPLEDWKQIDWVYDPSTGKIIKAYPHGHPEMAISADAAGDVPIDPIEPPETITSTTSGIQIPLDMVSPEIQDAYLKQKATWDATEAGTKALAGASAAPEVASTAPELASTAPELASTAPEVASTAPAVASARATGTLGLVGGVGAAAAPVEAEATGTLGLVGGVGAGGAAAAPVEAAGAVGTGAVGTGAAAGAVGAGAVGTGAAAGAVGAGATGTLGLVGGAGAVGAGAVGAGATGTLGLVGGVGAVGVGAVGVGAGGAALMIAPPTGLPG
jgi:hypothetical protein